jgi:uncharacterized membrane protein
MRFVKEVTYYDDQRSHWVVDIVGPHEWDAVNENWEKYRQIGWHSYNGLENTGRVTFETVGPLQTLVDVHIAYDPPAGALGDAGEKLGVGSHFEKALQKTWTILFAWWNKLHLGHWIPSHLANPMCKFFKQPTDPIEAEEPDLAN